MCDLGSTYGTLVNGIKIDRPTVVGDEDQIRAGQLSLTFGECRPVGTVTFIEDSASLASPDSASATLESMLDAENGVRSGEHMRALIRAGRELSTHLPLKQLFDLILDLSIQAVSASRGVLMTLEAGSLRVRASQGEALRISTHVRDLVLQESVHCWCRMRPWMRHWLRTTVSWPIMFEVCSQFRYKRMSA